MQEEGNAGSAQTGAKPQTGVGWHCKMTNIFCKFACKSLSNEVRKGKESRILDTCYCNEPQIPTKAAYQYICMAAFNTNYFLSNNINLQITLIYLFSNNINLLRLSASTVATLWYLALTPSVTSSIFHIFL